MIKNFGCLALAGVVMALPFTAHAETGPFDREVLGVAEALVSSMDGDADGIVSAREHKGYSRLAHASIDADSDGRIDKREFLTWDPGFAWVADRRGTAEQFADAKRDVFGLWDANSDGQISKVEWFAMTKSDFIQADRDQDGRANTTDVWNGSLSLVALMSAI